MDLNHIIIPLEWNDRLMFSELWVDPDEEENLKKGKGRKDNEEGVVFEVPHPLPNGGVGLELVEGP